MIGIMMKMRDAILGDFYSDDESNRKVLDLDIFGEISLSKDFLESGYRPKILNEYRVPLEVGFHKGIAASDIIEKMAKIAEEYDKIAGTDFYSSILFSLK